MSASIVVPLAAVRRAWLDSPDTVGDIAKSFGISYGALYHLVQQQGWPQRSRRPKSAKLTIEGVEPPTAAGVLDEEIARHFGVTVQAVRIFRIRKGIKKKRGKGITMADFLARKAETDMAAAMARSAAETRAVLKLCEMADHPSIFNKRAA